MKTILIIVSTLLMMANTAIAMTDPMQPPGIDGKKITIAGKRQRDRWELTSTLIGQKRSRATINGKTIAVGERVDGAKVIDIQPAVVTLSYQNRSIVLKLFHSLVKRQRRTVLE